MAIMKKTILLYTVITHVIAYAHQEIPMYLYKIISPEQWQESQTKDALVLDKNDTEFIHFSTEEQVDRILNKFWANKPNIVLKVDPQKLPGALILEANRPGGDKYYHLYDGAIPHSAIISMQ